MASSTGIFAYWLFITMTHFILQGVLGSPFDLSEGELRAEREISDSTDYEREERIWKHIKDFFGGFLG
ncbi:hypothetical protein DAPPUDRAFT_237103 [Daphnia pulex]|uniref:Uncharacterized protein n=1 Tax=Daphnia pulex TaxID=6669 RepID=E9G462_DAPPU|nr:hypothetical protein DAPPUDRAFT_237103 [Daphnia pulex]|eukprot:EFX85698.1 hypothetical protein DAPPUDRAFT_237103 [Daphnia pulex]